MITEISFSKEWITKKAKEFKVTSPDILEKAIYALYFLECLAQSELKFVFKGGTALTILLNEEKRFSTDIDIASTDSEDNFDDFLDDLVYKEKGIFIKYERIERKPSNVKKTHYKIFYNSIVLNEVQNILFDIVFYDLEDISTVKATIKSNFLKQESEELQVTTLSIDSLLGDKLTTLASKTCGISQDKDLSIAKQIYDIDRLFDYFKDIKEVEKAFQIICTHQIAINKLEIKTSYILEEIIENAICFAKGYYGIKLSSEEESYFNCLIDGLSKLQSNLVPFFNKRGVKRIDFFRAIAKAAYISAIIKSGNLNNFKKYQTDIQLEVLLKFQNNKIFNRIQNLDKEIHYYLISAIKLVGLDK